MKKHHVCLQEACQLRGMPSGDTIIFPTGSPLHARKDMLAAVLYGACATAFTPH